MGTIDISYLSLGIGLLLLSIPLFYIWKFKTGLLRATLIGTARMIVQLFFIGIYLKYLFLWNNPWINFLWVIVMILVASQTALARTQLKRKILLIPISVGFLCSVVCVGMYFIGIVLRLENVFSAQYFIPIFGILMGNMLSSNVIALNTYYSGLKREQQLYRYLLGNGATRTEAQAQNLILILFLMKKICLLKMPHMYHLTWKQLVFLLSMMGLQNLVQLKLKMVK